MNRSISVFVVTFNEEENIARCLSSLQGLFDEIVVVDSNSVDCTREIAAEMGAHVVTRAWTGFVDQKNFALDQCAHDWVFSLDADEEVSPKLRDELVALTPQLAEIGARDKVWGWAVPRLTQYGGRWIRHGDWYPDYVTRLVYRPRTRFAGGEPHASAQVDGVVRKLKEPLLHYSYRDEADHRARVEKYSSIWAQSQWKEGRRTGAFSPYSRAAFRFVRAAILKRGFLDGALGWRIAAFSAREVFWKYRKLRVLQQRGDGSTL
ncbi:MAG: hypothetical protein JWN98_282 [Abditibacteriota bacterium]|nr:hypothetical protein [Abditibacteriota bacterium]